MPAGPSDNNAPNMTALPLFSLEDRSRNPKTPPPSRNARSQQIRFTDLEDTSPIAAIAHRKHSFSSSRDDKHLNSNPVSRSHP